MRIVLFFIALVFCNNLFAYSKTVQRAGDIVAVLTPLSAFAVALSKGDNIGASQMAEGALWTAVITHGTKYFVDAERPNKKNLNSFPSGHTSAAFQGAFFVNFRYGFAYALPFYVASSFVAYSRVYSEYHYTRDVIAGALLAFAVQYVVSETNFNLTNYVVEPYLEKNSTGVSFTYRF